MRAGNVNDDTKHVSAAGGQPYAEGASSDATIDEVQPGWDGALMPVIMQHNTGGILIEQNYSIHMILEEKNKGQTARTAICSSEFTPLVSRA